MLTAQVSGRSKARLVLTMQVADITGLHMDGASTAALAHRRRPELVRLFVRDQMVQTLQIRTALAQGLSRHQVKQRLSIAAVLTLMM